MSGILSSLACDSNLVQHHTTTATDFDEVEECKYDDPDISDLASDYQDAYLGTTYETTTKNEIQQSSLDQAFSHLKLEVQGKPSEPSNFSVTNSPKMYRRETVYTSKVKAAKLSSSFSSQPETSLATSPSSPPVDREPSSNSITPVADRSLNTNRDTIELQLDGSEEKLEKAIAQFERHTVTLRRLFGRFSSRQGFFTNKHVLKSMQAALKHIKSKEDEPISNYQGEPVIVRKTKAETIESGLPFRGFRRALGELALMLPSTEAAEGSKGELSPEGCAIAILLLLDAKCGMFSSLSISKVDYPAAFTVAGVHGREEADDNKSEESSLSKGYAQSNRVLYSAGMTAMKSANRKHATRKQCAQDMFSVKPLERRPKAESPKAKTVNTKEFVARMESAEQQRLRKLQNLKEKKLQQEAVVFRKHIPRVNEASRIMVEDQTKEEIFERLHNSRKIYLEQNQKYLHDLVFRDPVTGQEFFKPKVNKSTLRKSKGNANVDGHLGTGTHNISEALYRNAMNKVSRRKKEEKELKKSLQERRDSSKVGNRSAKYVARRVVRQVTLAFRKYAEPVNGNPGWVPTPSSNYEYGEVDDEQLSLPFRSLGDVLRTLGYFYSGDLSQMPQKERELEREIQLKLWSELVQPSESGHTGVSLSSLIEFCQQVVMPGVRTKQPVSKDNAQTFRELMNSKPLRKELITEFRRREVSRKAYAGGLSSNLQDDGASFCMTDSVKSTSMFDDADSGMESVQEEPELTFQPQINSYSRELDHVASHRWTADNGKQVSREEIMLHRHRVAETRKEYLRREKARKELEECTFKPQLNKPKKGEPRHVTKARLEGKLTSAKVLSETRTTEEIELQENCTFQPDRSSTSKTPPVKKATAMAKKSDASTVPKAFSETIERLRRGRIERERVARVLERGREVTPSKAKRNAQGEVIVEPFTFQSESRIRKRSDEEGKTAAKQTNFSVSANLSQQYPNTCGDTKLSEMPMLSTKAPPSPVPPSHLLTNLVSSRISEVSSQVSEEGWQLSSQSGESDSQHPSPAISSIGTLASHEESGERTCGLYKPAPVASFQTQQQSKHEQYTSDNLFAVREVEQSESYKGTTKNLECASFVKTEQDFKNDSKCVNYNQHDFDTSGNLEHSPVLSSEYNAQEENFGKELKPTLDVFETTMDNDRKGIRGTNATNITQNCELNYPVRSEGREEFGVKRDSNRKRNGCHSVAPNETVQLFENTFTTSPDNILSEPVSETQNSNSSTSSQRNNHAEHQKVNEHVQCNEPSRGASHKDVSVQHQEKHTDTPLLYVDISVKRGQQERIAVYENDNIHDVAKAFAEAHQLGVAVETKLVRLLQNQMSMVLQIEEDEEVSEED